MDSFVRRFIRASLIWLGTGVLLGIAMAWWPERALAYRTAHAHANLLGFVSMMIFGVAYHVVPRFSSRPLHAPRLAALHLWVANAGLAGLVGGWVLRAHGAPVGVTMLRAGSVLAAGGAFLFIYNLWRTLPTAAPAPVRIGSAPTPEAQRARMMT
jgi:heme/copper-type cytochrome/quinol oxidase subunit 1